MTEIIKIENEKTINYSKEIKKVVNCIEKGGLVILPTETVYGIAARKDSDESIRKLLELRKSPQDKNLTIAIGNLDQLRKYIKIIAPSTSRIIERFMPGPITIVFDYEDTGIRFPDNYFTQQVLSKCNFPVVLPSANLSSMPPKCTGEEVIKEFNDKVDIIVDGGPTRLKTSSTVIRSGFGILQELRKGPIDFSEIRKTAKITILFVCTGNTCRSPLAEIFLKHLLAQKYEIPLKNLKDFGFDILSCGIATYDGLSANSFAIEIAQKYNLDLSYHRTMQITQKICKESDIMFCMTEEHVAYVIKLCPENLLKVRKLKSGGEDIKDPALGSYNEYDLCARTIMEEVKKIAENI